MRLLFLDRPETAGKDLQSLLRLSRHRVDLVTDAAKAASCVDRVPYDAVILDRSFLVSTAKRRGWLSFHKKIEALPVVILSENGNARGLSAWLARQGVLLASRQAGAGQIVRTARLAREFVGHKNEIDGMRDEMNRKAEELAFFVDVGRALTSTLDLKAILKTVMDKTRDLIQGEAWSILLVDEERQDLVFEVATGEKGKKLEKKRLKKGQGIAGWVAQEGVPLIVPDVRKDQRFFSGFDEKTKFTTRSVMAVPIISKEQVIGVVEVINKKGGDSFGRKDLDLLLKLVDQAAIAVEHARIYQKMADLAVTDDLTNLFNMRYLARTLEVEIERARRHGASVSLIFIDLDHFKEINDQHGHLMGSRVLIEVAQILLRNIRSIDVVARYGGDEFVVVLPQTDPAAAFAIAERVRRSIAGHTFLKGEGLQIRLTASCGIAAYPDHAKSKEDLIRLADEAMYRVKHEVRDSVYIVGHG